MDSEYRNRVNVPTPSRYSEDPDLLDSDLKQAVAAQFGDSAALADELTMEPLIQYQTVHEALRPGLIDALTELQKNLLHDPGHGKELTEAALSEYPALIMLFELASNEPDVDQEAAFGREAFLTEAEIVEFRKVVAACRPLMPFVAPVMERVDTDPAFMRLIGSLDPTGVEKFVGLYHASGKWLKPTEALMPISGIQASIEGSTLGILQPQEWASLLLNVDHYKAAVTRFEALKQPYLADIAKLFLFHAQAMQYSMRGGDPVPFADVRALLDRIDSYPDERLAMFGQLSQMVMGMRGTVRLLVSMDPAISTNLRRENLQKAEELLYACRSIPPLRWLLPNVRWMRAQTLKGLRKQEVELEAFALVNELVADTAREKDLLQRLMGMAMLTLLPANWKFQKADYVGAIESAATAKSFAVSAIAEMEAWSNAFRDQIEKELASREATDPAAATELNNFRAFVIKIAEGSRVMTDACETFTLTSKAKLADRAGEYERASEYYEQAAAYEEEIVRKVREAVTTWFAATSPTGRMGRPAAQTHARAVYYGAMAELSRGDQAFMDGEIRTAIDHYEAAKEAFENAAHSWKEELRLSGPTSEKQLGPLRNEQGICLIRMRYCEAKIDIANAESYSAAGRAWDSAYKFERVTRIFSELRTSLDLESGLEGATRDAKLLIACEDFSRARYLMELDRDTRRNGNFEPCSSPSRRRRRASMIATSSNGQNISRPCAGSTAKKVTLALPGRCDDCRCRSRATHRRKVLRPRHNRPSINSEMPPSHPRTTGRRTWNSDSCKRAPSRWVKAFRTSRRCLTAAASMRPAMPI